MSVSRKGSDGWEGLIKWHREDDGMFASRSMEGKGLKKGIKVYVL